MQASGLKLQASVPGAQENAKDGWLWSGSIPAHGAATIEVGYQVGSLKGITYRVGPQSGVNQVRVTFKRRDLDSMRFESGDGPVTAESGQVVWERQDFLGPDFFSAGIVEGRNLFTALMQLAEVGPVISLLFLLALVAILLGRQKVTVIQMFTIAAGYALYFPLILYLSSRFRFGVALAMAFLIPGALLVNYARFLLGGRLGLFGTPLFLALYQVFPTLAVFAGWNRGMVLLCLGVVTLWVLINLQNRALRTQAVAAGLLVLLSGPPLNAAEVQVLLPADLVTKVLPPEAQTSVLACQTAEYQIRHETTYLHVDARLPFNILDATRNPAPLFTLPVHLEASRIESDETNLAQLITVTNRLSLHVKRSGTGTLSLSYRVPIENRDGKKRAQIPMIAATSGSVRLISPRNDLEFLTGSLWTNLASGQATTYQLGVAGDNALVVEWRDQAEPPSGRSAEPAQGLYGIGLTRAQNLTVVNSDGSCLHFVEFELPAAQREDFRVRLPTGVRLVSASINGTEIAAPDLQDRLCRVRLPEGTPRQSPHRLSFRLAYPAVSLGFMGSLELMLPEVFQTTGTLEWVVALPAGFETQILTSGMENQRATPDLSAFGDYGRVLKSHFQISLSKTLAPPGSIGLNLKYRQIVPGIHDTRTE